MWGECGVRHRPEWRIGIEGGSPIIKDNRCDVGEGEGEKKVRELFRTPGRPPLPDNAAASVERLWKTEECSQDFGQEAHFFPCHIRSTRSSQTTPSLQTTRSLRRPDTRFDGALRTALTSTVRTRCGHSAGVQPQACRAQARTVHAMKRVDTDRLQGLIGPLVWTLLESQADNCPWSIGVDATM